jgi:hypothetical protein
VTTRTVRASRSFLAEKYWPGIDGRTAAEAARRLGEELAALIDEAGPVPTVACTYVPAEEAVLCVVRADTEALVRELGRRADVTFDRVVEAVVLLPRNEE